MGDRCRAVAVLLAAIVVTGCAENAQPGNVTVPAYAQAPPDDHAVGPAVAAYLDRPTPATSTW